MKARNLLLFLLVLFCMGQLNAQTLGHDHHGDNHEYVNELIENAKAKNAFQVIDLFDQVEAEDVKSTRSDLQNSLSEGTVLKPKALVLNQIAQNAPMTMTMTLPRTNATPITLELVKVDLFAPGFEVIKSSTNSPVDVELGAHYHGRILGQPHSMAAISIFGTEIAGLVTTKGSNLVIGKLEGRYAGNDHIFYDDADLKTNNGFTCDTPDDDKFTGYTEAELSDAHQKATGDCVVLYIEVANDIHNDKGGVAGATNYTTALFNQSFLLYQAESINFSFGTIFVWDSPDPYTSTSSSGQLSQFQGNVSSIGGATLGHLISYEASGGIAAGFSGVCNSNVDNSLCFSSIDASFGNVPIYSFTLMVVTHEMGHLLGSRHTHACVWNGNNTAIDGCAGATEGSCSLPGFPAGGGTIMSYCHLQSVGIDLNSGFGPQPGAVIRNTLANASCTSACADPTCDDGIQNGDEEGVDCGGSCGNVCPITYCSSGGANSSFEWIETANIGNVNNTSGNNGGYGDFTSLSVSADQGSTVNVFLAPAFSGTPYAENWAVFVDYNADGDFDDANETVFTGSTAAAAGVSLSGSFTVPAGAALGDTRMRVVMAWNTAALSCGTVSYGESEDYGFSVTTASGPTCSDGVQNGNETGVDCGGPDCPACPPTCTDGVQNGDETGVDCGGSSCPACPPTCTDGVQNGDETGVDCGGSSCPACPPTCTDGVQNGDETGVDCGGSSCPACPPTCTDGVQNGDETGVDCGGSSCPACPPTCTDGVQNGDETGVDCGGSSCPACPPTCTDGVQNGDETGVDCGGSSCPACPPTCTDGVQNGDEEGVDCGGSSCEPCSTGCSYEVINFNNFNNNWGIWNDGGSDCRRSANDAQYAVGGTGRPVRLRDNTSTSTMTTDVLDLSAYDELTISFSYLCRSMDNANEDFWFQISSDGGATYTIVEEWNRGDEFNNDVRYNESFTVAGSFSANTRLRFRADASGNSDWVYIDDVEISGCNNGAGALMEAVPAERPRPAVQVPTKDLNIETISMSMFPNPTNGLLNVNLLNAENSLNAQIFDLNGRVVWVGELNAGSNQIDVSKLATGMYYMNVLTNDGQRITQKFVRSE